MDVLLGTATRARADEAIVVLCSRSLDLEIHHLLALRKAATLSLRVKVAWDCYTLGGTSGRTKTYAADTLVIPHGAEITESTQTLSRTVPTRRRSIVE